MPNMNITKKALAEAMKELVEEKPFLKISIKDICRRCNMNRGSFYYHFKDKNELVEWIFINDFIKPIQSKSVGYNRNIFLRELINYFYNNLSYYAIVLSFKGQNSFSSSLRRILHPLIHGDMATVLEDGKKLNFCVDFYCDMIVSILTTWITSEEIMSPEEFIEFANYAIVDVAKVIEY